MDGKRRQPQGLGIQARLAPLFNVIDRSSHDRSGDKPSDGGGGGGGGGGRGSRTASKGKDDGGSSSSSLVGFGIGGGGGGGGGGGLGPQLAGEKIALNGRVVSVLKQLGEGGFSFVYLVKDEADKSLGSPTNKSPGRPSGVIRNSSSNSSAPSGSDSSSPNHLNNTHMVLKITSIHSREQREIAEKEATLLQRLRHPSIVKIFDCCYRSPPPSHSSSYTTSASSLVSNISRATGIPLTRNSNNNNNDPSPPSSQTSSSHSSHHHPSHPRPQHLILMEYCEGGHALAAMQRMASQNERYSLPGLIIAFGQICNAVSYMHAQKPPIVHRDLKLNNFLLQRGAYKLCDFGSAIFGEVSLDGVEKKRAAEDVILKTTTQMFRAPEMVDLYMSDRLTQSTDVWALGCCLYSMAFFQNCFEEGSNLAILSKNVKIPEQHPYGDGLVELIDRMLTVNHEERADMTEVILCLSALYSGKPLPARTKGKSSKNAAKKSADDRDHHSTGNGSFRTDGQGIHRDATSPKKPVEAKKLNPNSAAARRRAGRGRSNKERTSSSAASTSSSSSMRKNGNNRHHGSDSRRHFNSKGTTSHDRERQRQQSSSSSMRISQSTADDGFEATFVDTFSSFRDANGDNSFSTMDNPFSSSNDCCDDKSTISNDNFLSFVGFDDAIAAPPPSSTPSPTNSSNSNNNCPFASADALSFSAISAPTTEGDGRGRAPQSSDGTTTTKTTNNSDFKMAPFDSNVTFPSLFDRFSSKKKDSPPLTDLFRQTDENQEKSTITANATGNVDEGQQHITTNQQSQAKRPLTVITNPNTIPKKETNDERIDDNTRRPSFEHLFPPPPTIKMSSSTGSFHTTSEDENDNDRYTTNNNNGNNNRHEPKCQLQTSTTF